MNSNPPLAVKPAPIAASGGGVQKNKAAGTKQKPIAASPAPTTSSEKTELSTSKVWVLPPRPKPGRKPSVDAPPTKRKAQNRAAQRAFRERRAARVGELEEKLFEMERERDEREKRLQRAIEDITRDNAQLRKSLQDLRGKAINTDYSMTPAASPMTVDNSHDMEVLDRALEQKLPVPNKENHSNNNDASSCGVCVKDDCICEAIGIREKPAPTAAVPLKRCQQKKQQSQPPQEEMEVDFTEMFARPKPKPKVADKCGFCSTGTPCLCADFAQDKQKEEAARNVVLPPLEIPSHPESNSRSSTSSTLSNPSSDPRSRSNSIKLPALHPDLTKAPTEAPSATPTCTGNPGNCSQCQTDPMSTLFCTTVASRTEEKEAATTGGTYIPCSAAYQTLSRHKDFNRADLGQLVGKLNTRGMQVEVSSVANVLRELDRRLYD
jgi:hypothetical protein